METCVTSLRLARLAADGTPIGSPQTAWGDDWVSARPALVATAGEIWLFVVRRDGVARETMLGRLDTGGLVLGDLVPLDEGRTAREDAPAAVLVDDRVIVVSTVMPGGLSATSLDASTAEVVAGPLIVASEISASAPQVASNDRLAGLVYIANAADGPGARLLFVEILTDLHLPFLPVEVVGDGLWPKRPQVAAAGPGWVAAWYDGRLDDVPDCANFGFCRDTVYLIAVSNAGPSGEPINLSDDPNDCEEPSIAAAAGTVSAAWLTLREGRRTAFTRRVTCE
jgi:hypothetical protein